MILRPKLHMAPYTDKSSLLDVSNLQRLDTDKGTDEVTQNETDDIVERPVDISLDPEVTQDTSGAMNNDEKTEKMDVAKFSVESTSMTGPLKCQTSSKTVSQDTLKVEMERKKLNLEKNFKDKMKNLETTTLKSLCGDTVTCPDGYESFTDDDGNTNCRMMVCGYINKDPLTNKTNSLKCSSGQSILTTSLGDNVCVDNCPGNQSPIIHNGVSWCPTPEKEKL